MIAAWDRSHSCRDWSSLSIEREKRKYTPQTTTRRIYFRGPVDLVSDAAKARSKKNAVVKPPEPPRKIVFPTREEERELAKSKVAKDDDLFHSFHEYSAFNRVLKDDAATRTAQRANSPKVRMA